MNKTEFKAYNAPSCEGLTSLEEAILCASAELDPITDNSDLIEWDD